MSAHDYGGQRHNMEDDTMVDTLRAQASIIWPLERELLARSGAAGSGRVLDIACGTGEILRRVKRDFRPGFVTGVDLFHGHLQRAPKPVSKGDGYRLPFGADTFDLALARHVTQALKDPVEFLREALRVLRPGGQVHVVAEDYAGLFFDTEDYAVANHFPEMSEAFRPRGTDLYQGRRAFRHLLEAGFENVRVDPLVVDTQNADRDTFAAVMMHWRDGYAGVLGEITGKGEAEMRRRFDVMIAGIRDESRYTAWLLFVVSGRKPG
jgi:ubiquinone/menaquinone biosynthesis C-methylase UbiE